ncbi:MAG TPA: carboxypeptidase regulatory-like domain-containing protein [Candidatus Polarisedimenticolia bacterium]|nr:carboxypeptidase regulatory-like domain-containing protein [Candidatus Polarisedimenticolia bacterium]
MRIRWSCSVGAIALTILAACGGGETPTESHKAKPSSAAKPAAGGYVAGPVTDGGSVSGKVTFAGTPPSPEKVEVSKDTSVCGTTKVLEGVEVGPGGGLANTVVWIDGITKGKDWGSVAPAVVDQKECHYVPYVQIMRVGDSIDVVNSDSVLHNIHAYHNETETLFNIAQPIKGQKTPKKIEKPGPVHFKCDVHSWMSAWAFVASHPYVALTNADGSFSFTEVPAGAYKIKVWHPKLGEKTADATVSAGGTATADFVMQ